MQNNLNQHTADIVLRSSDGTLFYSWKTLLSISSPVFSDMFTLTQPATLNDTDDGRPVIDLTEDSCTLGRILSLCHPASCTGKQFKVESVPELGAVLEVTTKYDMENIRSVVLEELTRPSFLRQDPVRIYALACQYGYPEAARLAAKHTLALPTLVRGYVPELEKIHAGTLCRLLLYREACMTAALDVAQDHAWILYPHSSPLFGCDGGESDNDVGWTTVRYHPSRKYRSGRVERVSVHTWWLDYMKKSGQALQRSPHGGAVKDKELVNDVLSTISSSDCKECDTSEVLETFRSFVEIFAEEIDSRVTRVCHL